MSTTSTNNEEQPQEEFVVHQGDNVLADLKKIYLNSKHADVDFGFKLQSATPEIPAHRALLAASSDKFAKIFDENSARLIKIGDNVTLAAFEEFLQFFYLSDVKVTHDNYLGVLHLGYKYRVQQCIDKCVELFDKVVRPKNVCRILSYAIRHNYDQRFIKSCEKIIILNTEDVFATIGFLACDRRTLEHIIKMDFLSCTEADVFEACMRWVKFKSEKNVLTMELIEAWMGDLINEIRFQAMQPQELCRLSIEYGLVLKSILNPTEMINTIANGVILDRRRCREFAWNGDATAICELENQRNELEIKCVLNIKQTLHFSTSEPLILGSFHCGRILVN